MRRGQGYTLRVTAVPTVRCRLLALCQPLDGGQGVPTVPAQGKARREYENRISTLVPTESCSFSPGPPYVNYSHPEENPRQLGRDHLDVVNLRIVGIDSIAERFGALAELRAAGLIRHLGLSNVRPHHLAEARTIAPVVCVQNMYGMGASPEQKKFLRNCGEQRIAFVPFCSIAGPGREGGATADDSREVRAIARPPRSQRGPGTAGVGPAPGAPRPGHPRYPAASTISPRTWPPVLCPCPRTNSLSWTHSTTRTPERDPAGCRSPSADRRVRTLRRAHLVGPVRRGGRPWPAACDVHRPRALGRCAATTGSTPTFRRPPKEPASTVQP
ncbi:hypothetical protein SRIMM317S_03146 [Streptomyces rimosus subsp. rimosus]